MNIEPFRIEVPGAVLDDLRERLAATRWPADLAGAQAWALGTDPAYLRELVEYWKDRYDWRRAEAALNRFDQFVTEIGGQRVHFVHQRAAAPGAEPLVLMSGWPSTFAEFAKVIGPLNERGYHVIAPSLPGFGFSGPTTAPGITPARIAAMFIELMRELGYGSYGLHGGDWGAMVASQMALQDPDRCRGLHLSMVIAPRPATDPLAGLTDAERADLDRMYRAGREEMGYQQIQGTRPQSVSAALADSPVGLAAWLIEKFRAWSDCGGDVESRFTSDELLTNITIYWVTGTIASANRIYAETRRAGRGASLPDRPVPVPMGYLRLPGDGFKPPRRWVDALYRVARWTTVEAGGHFPAYEVPDLLVDDIDAFFGSL